jgi:hypothetical protein
MAQAMRTVAPGEVFDRQVHTDRRRVPRSPEIHARRRSSLHVTTERRRATSGSFDIAAALELNLDRFPTTGGMLALLHSWLYIAEREGLDERRLAYVYALRDAINVMEDAPSPVHAIALLNVTIGGVRVIGTITTPEEVAD